MKFLRISAVCIILTGADLLAQSTLDSLPQYSPSQHVSGTIRNYGSPLAGVVKGWEEGFEKYQPDVKFADEFAGSDAAVSGLETKHYDLAPNGREATFVEHLSFFEVFGSNPFEVTVGTGAYDIPGRTWAEVIFVNKDNPLAKLTMKQLDGIFGAERTGGLQGFVLDPNYARTAKDNIRTWGQLGLTGEWKDKPIQTYGYGPTGMTFFFQQKVFHGGDKWNPNYREYAESGTKMVDTKETPVLGSHDMLVAISKDKYAIGWGGVGQARGIPGLKMIALSRKEGGPYIDPTRENIANRSYPLTRSIFICLHHAPGQPIDPKLKEFLFYVLSREGQEVIRKEGEYLPLTSEVVEEQRKRLQ